MKNSIWILLYITLLAAVVFFEYKKSDNVNRGMAMHKYKIEQNRALDDLILGYTKPLSTTSVADKQWGILPKKVKKEKKVIKENSKIKLVTVTLKDKILCIEKECFKLLGIFQKGEQYYASFYNKNSKKAVKETLVGERINSSIKIKSIVQNQVVFSDINSTREWSIKMFDVNSSKYKPKDFE